ncbi:MAG TPA: hypothetical protein VNN74_08870 [Candidatus Micrarchaeia archaeon]|nr:hypothetical protein [Candidatus Micrarchaeia archaeon]
MRRGCAATVIGLAGPDGAGKTAASRALVALVRQQGGWAAAIHAYGCVVCRRTGGHAATGGRRASPGRPVARLWLGDRLAGAHAVVDALELRLRVSVATRSARAHAPGARGRAGPQRAPALVVTDRTPLDGLVKFDPRPGSIAARAFAAQLRRYRLLAILDAPVAVLIARDPSSTIAELTRSREGFARHGRSLARVLSIDTGALTPVEVAVRVLAAASAPLAGPAPGTADAAAAHATDGRAGA